MKNPDEKLKIILKEMIMTLFLFPEGENFIV